MQMVDRMGSGDWHSKATQLGTGRSGGATYHRWRKLREVNANERKGTKRQGHFGNRSCSHAHSIDLKMERFYRENAATEDSASLSDDEDLSSDEWSEEEDEDDESRPKRVAWTLEEDRKLTQLVHTDGANNWSSKATRLGTGRSGGAVNIRWNRLQRKAAVSASPPEKQQEVEPTILSLAWKAEKDDDSDATEEEDEAIARSAANAEHPTVTVGTWKDAAEALVATRRAKGAASSPYIGVSWHKTGRVWRAQISESSKQNTLRLAASAQKRRLQGRTMPEPGRCEALQRVEAAEAAAESCTR